MSAIKSATDVKQNSDPLVSIRGLRTVLNGKTIFDGVDLDIPRGGITAIMGPSGTGKTTLMRHITGQLAPDAGAILVDGLDVGRIDRDALFALREKIGYLFQNSALLTDYSVFENVAFPLRQHLKLPEEILRNIVLTKLQAVGLRGAAELMPSELSGGMVRRVALARAIVRDPMMIIYDEPFVGLDPIALNQILKLIRTLNQTLGITSILVAHELAAVRLVADHIYLIAGGKIVAHGVPDELARGETPWTRQFFSGEADGPVPFHYPAPDYATQLGLDGGGRDAATLTRPLDPRATPPSSASRAREEGVAAQHPEPKS
jgi:phospholipid/cholesterol/gamma-HCH transport system ATP-binding protein